MELEKRGFLVKEWFSIKYLLQSFLQLLLWILILWSIWFFTIQFISNPFEAKNVGIETFFMGVFLFFLSWSLLNLSVKALRTHIKLWRLFFSERGYIILNKLYPYDRVFKEFPMLENSTKTFKDFIISMKWNIGLLLVTITSILLMLMPIVLFLVRFPLVTISSFLGIITLFLVTRKIIDHQQSFHPLYAFGNLGEMIQKLTPQIESKSIEIQESFHKDMNFRVLSDGFDSLSTTFSEIIWLVIRLEKIE